MKRTVIMILAGVIGICGIAAAATPSSRMPSDFDVLTRKSIFSNQPGRPTAERSWSRRQQEPAGLPVLVGIIREDAKFIAVVEDPASGKSYRLVPGDKLPQNGGTVEELTLDSMSIKSGESLQKKIFVGQNITGGVATFAAPADSAPAAEGGAPSDSPPAAAGSAEERMRLRRMQQQGNK